MRESCRMSLACLAAAAFMRMALAEPPEEVTPRPEDYAYGWPILAPAPSDFYELELPLDVYRSVVDPSLRDLGVFDAHDRPVPRFVSAPPAPRAAPDEPVPLVLLPVMAPAGTALSDVRFTLEQEAGATRVRVEGGAPATAERPLALVAYLTDMGEEHARLAALDVEWPAEAEPLIATLTVEASTDLGAWAVVGRGTVAGLRQDASSIERRRVTVNPREARYLRLTWQGAPPGFALTRLTAQYSRAAPEPARAEQSLATNGTDAADGGLLYDLGGAPMVDRATLDLGGDIALLRASVHCRLAEREPWIRMQEGLYYRLHRDGNELVSEPAALPPRRCRYWKVLVERGAREARPTLRLGWLPDRVIFVAEGEGPWTLAVGSARDPAAGFPQERYADPGLRRLAEKSTLVTASLGARDELGGELALEAPAKGPDWRRWLLWLGLVAGVALVAGMAWRLARGGGGN